MAGRPDDGARRRASLVDVPVQHRGLEAAGAQQHGYRLRDGDGAVAPAGAAEREREVRLALRDVGRQQQREEAVEVVEELLRRGLVEHVALDGIVEAGERAQLVDPVRSEEHTSELQSLMRSSYAVFCLNKKTQPY